MRRPVGSAVAALLSLASTVFGMELGDRAAPPDRVLLKNGDVLSGTIVRSSPESVTIEHPQLGPVTIGADKVERFGPAEAVKVSMPVDQLAEDARKLAAENAAKDAKKAWQVSVALAFAGAWSSDEEISLRAGIGASRDDERSRFAVTGEYYLRTLDNATTDNNLLLQALQEWYFQGTPWLLFAQGTYQYDELEPWEHRISLYGGPGYRAIDSEAMKLTLRLGAGATYEVGSDEWSPQVLLAEDFSWRISARQRFSFNSSIAPNVTDPLDFLLTVQAEYAVAVADSKKGLSLTAGARDIYDNDPADGSSGNDLRVYAGLRYDF